MTAARRKDLGGDVTLARAPRYISSVDLQALKQAQACIAQALSLYIRLDAGDATTAITQVELAWRFLDEFVARHGTSR
jgi:hypothetical protein